LKKVKIAQIGTSRHSHGSGIFPALTKNSDIFDVAGYHFPENEREKFPEMLKPFENFRELTLEEILENPEIEAVSVETEEIYLTKYALMAAQKGKHIHIEKPGGLEKEAFEKLIETVKKNNTVFHTGYMYRYNPFVNQLLCDIKNGELGDIISVEAQMNCYHEKEVREWLSNFPGGMMFFLGCHLIDLIYQIQGEPENIIPLNRATHLDGASGEDFGMAVFEYKNGVSFAKAADVELGGYERRQLVVTGTKKTVEIRPLEWYVADKLISEKYTKESIHWHDRSEVEKSEIFDRYDKMMRSFGQMVRGEIKNPYSYDYELQLYKTILKACGI